jgi:FkbM family methyltransferase
MNLIPKIIKLGDYSAIFYGISDDDIYFKQFIVDQSENEFLYIASTLIHPGDIVIDIGANIGLKTFILSKIVGDTGRVISIEAGPNVAEVLRANVIENKLGNVTIINAACSSQSGKVIFFEHSAWGTVKSNAKFSICDNNAEFNFYNKENINQIDFIDKYKTIDSISIDDLVSNYNLEKVNFIKIDTEGHEMSILQGAKNVLMKFKPIIFAEFISHGLILNSHINPIDFLDYINSIFNNIYVVKHFLVGNFQRISPLDFNSVIFNNIAFNNGCDDLLLSVEKISENDFNNLILKFNNFKNNIYKSKFSVIINIFYSFLKILIPKNFRTSLKDYIYQRFFSNRST